MQPERGFEPGRPPAFPPTIPRVFPLRVDLSWIAAGALLVAHLSFSAFGDRTLVPSVFLGLAALGIFFLTVVVHGVGHLLALRTLSDGSRLYVFGDVSSAPRTIPVALAGPLASAILGAALVGLSSVLGSAQDVVRVAGSASLAVAAINLVPGLPLDGGHVLAAVTGRRRLAVRIGQLFGVAAVAGGIWLLLSGPAILEDTAFGLWLLLAGVFILSQARATDRTVPKWQLDSETAGAWARPFVGRVGAADPVPPDGGPYAVSDGPRLAGVLADGMPTDPKKRCGDVMVRWSPELGVRTDAPLRDALERLAHRSTIVVVVVDEKGVVRGVLDENAVRTRIGTR